MATLSWAEQNVSDELSGALVSIAALIAHRPDTAGPVVEAVRGKLGDGEAALLRTLAGGLEWNRERADEFAAALDGSALETLLIALTDETGNRNASSLVDTVRATVAETYAAETNSGIPGDAPIAVVFEADEWDNGWFLDHNNGTVFFADGSHDEGIEFDVHDEMTDTYGRVPSQAVLAVDLRTGTVTYEEDSPDDVYRDLGIKDLNIARQSEGPDDNRAPAKN